MLANANIWLQLKNSDAKEELGSPMEKQSQFQDKVFFFKPKLEGC